jgi:uncharacterized protein (TIGR03083 family)
METSQNASTHECYRQVRANVTGLLTTHRPAAAAAVPGCPEWTLQELVGHLVDVAGMAIGRLAGRPPTEPAPPAGTDVAGLLAAWERLGAEADRLLADTGTRNADILVMDAFTHELDICYAIGAEPPGEHPAFPVAFEVLVNGFAGAVAAHGLPALRLSTGSTEWTVGEGAPAATLTASRYDLCRSLAGRRSHEQIAALGWNRDATRWLPAFAWGPFTPPAAPVEPLG